MSWAAGCMCVQYMCVQQLSSLTRGELAAPNVVPWVAMAKRPGKLAKINALRMKLPHITQSALSAVLSAAKAEALPDLSKTTGIRAARDSLVDQSTPYGQVLQHVPFAVHGWGSLVVGGASVLASALHSRKAKRWVRSADKKPTPEGWPSDIIEAMEARSVYRRS